MRIKGRYVVVGWTAVFLAAAIVIVVRDHSGFAMRQRFDASNHHIAALEGARADYERQIAVLSSRLALMPKVEALGLRFPSDSAIVALRVSTPR